MPKKLYSKIIFFLPIFFFLFSFALFFFLNTHHIHAGEGGVVLLEDYKIDGKAIENGVTSGKDPVKFSSFMRMIIKLALGFGVITAVVMIVYGGATYVTTDTFTGKSKGKEIIQRAFLGLGLIFASFLILTLINPHILNEEISIHAVKVNNCSYINQKNEKALNKWETEHPDWEFGGGPYYTVSHDNTSNNESDTTTVKTECKPDFKTCQDQVKKINDQTAADRAQSETDEVYGYFYAKCLECVGDKCYKTDKTSAGAGDEKTQVFLYICESYILHTINPLTLIGSDMIVKKVDCGADEEQREEEIKAEEAYNKKTTEFIESMKTALKNCNKKHIIDGAGDCYHGLIGEIDKFKENDICLSSTNYNALPSYCSEDSRDDPLYSQKILRSDLRVTLEEIRDEAVEKFEDPGKDRNYYIKQKAGYFGNSDIKYDTEEECLKAGKDNNYKDYYCSDSTFSTKYRLYYCDNFLDTGACDIN